MKALRDLVRRVHAEEGGFAAGFEVALGVLVFVVGLLIVVQAWAVVDAKFAAASAAREAVRAYVEAPDEASAQRRAELAAGRALQGLGRDQARMTVTRVAAGSGAFGRCAPVTYEVRSQVPRVLLGNFGTLPPIQVASRATELVDPLRGGLAGRASCLDP